MPPPAAPPGSPGTAARGSELLRCHGTSCKPFPCVGRLLRGKKASHKLILWVASRGHRKQNKALAWVTQQIRPEPGRQPKSPCSHLPYFTLQGKNQTLPAHGCGWCLALLHGGCRGPGRLLPKISESFSCMELKFMCIHKNSFFFFFPSWKCLVNPNATWQK